MLKPTIITLLIILSIIGISMFAYEQGRASFEADSIVHRTSPR